MIDLGLTGARALVFGAGQIPERAGLGPTTAVRLAEAGARVACVDIDPDRAAETVAKIEAAGGSAVPLVADVMDEDQVAGAVSAAVDVFGGVDVCVDIVGHTHWSKLVDTTGEVWDLALRENLTQCISGVGRPIGGLPRQHRCSVRGSPGGCGAIAAGLPPALRPPSAFVPRP